MPPKKPVAAKAPVKAATKPAPRPAAGRGTTPAAKKGAVAPGINFITFRIVKVLQYEQYVLSNAVQNKESDTRR